jgi:serine/threonine protein kinase
MSTKQTAVDKDDERARSTGAPPSLPAPVVKLVRVPSVPPKSNEAGAMAQPTGQQQFGSYALEERLAIGGMAEVFRARRIGAAGFSRMVVIKRILPAFCQDRPFVEMFIDEANTGAQLRHSNIVAIDDFGEVDGQYFLAMEFVQGVDATRLLSALMADRRALPWEVGAFMLREVLAALDYAHRKKAPDGGPLNVVHRDVSPHNVLLSYSGEVKLTDFGIARARTRIHQTSAHVVKGKLAYMAPEQARALALDGRADLFAAGVSAFEWLANQRPFTGKNEPEVVSNLLRGRRPRLKELRPDVPDALESVIDGLLEPDRDRRIESASTALGLLDPLVSPAGGRLLASIVGHYFASPMSVVRAGPVAFSSQSLPPSPTIEAGIAAAAPAPLAPVAPVAPVALPPAPPAAFAAPRLSARAPAQSALPSTVETQVNAAPQPAESTGPELFAGTNSSLVSQPPADERTDVSAVIEAPQSPTDPQATESVVVASSSSSLSREPDVSAIAPTISAASVAVRVQDAVTQTSMRPVVDEPMADPSAATRTMVSVGERDARPAKGSRAATRRPSMVVVVTVAVIALVAMVVLVAFRAGATVSEAHTQSAPLVAPTTRDERAGVSQGERVSPVTPVTAVTPVTLVAPIAPSSVSAPARPTVATAQTPTTRTPSTRATRRPSSTRSGWGTVSIQALPWAEVSIDGHPAGITPIYRAISTGTHRVTLVHPPTGQRATRSLSVARGAVTRLSVSLVR